MLLLADAQSSKSEDSEDESYAASIASSVSLGSQDTGEVDDLAIEAATMLIPKSVHKKSPVPATAPVTATASVKKKRLSLPLSLPLLLVACLYKPSTLF